MKKSKKILAALLAGVMVLGTGLVAFAANNSTETSEGTPAPTKATITVSAGSGTIAEITNEETQKLVKEKFAEIDNYVIEHCTDANGQESTVYDYYAFDVQGIEKGEVSIKVDGLANLVKDIKTLGVKPVAMVFHYNETSKQWEGPVWSDITEDGALTFKFDSYSPIMVVITDVSAVDGQAVAPMAYSANPTQTVAASPKTGDATAAWLVLFGAAVVAVAVSRKKLFA